jgi:hypothetical protein
MTIFDRKTGTEIEELNSPEHELWVCVLSKAAHDALYSSDWWQSRLAIEWFKGKGRDFADVCKNAGKNPDYVHRKMIKQIIEREEMMRSVRKGSRLCVKPTFEPKRKRQSGPTGQYHGRYRGGRLVKRLTGNSYYAAKRANLH